MRTLDIRHARQQFARLLKEAEAGSETLITRNGKPVARVVPAVLSRETPERAAALERMEKLMEDGLPIGGRRWTRDEMH
jgi:prevent-host-death family protein